MSENSKKPRRQFTADLKYQILREARQTGTPVSQVCVKHQISPTLFYQWERAAERGAKTALNAQPRGRKKLRPSEEALLVELTRLREVVTELSADLRPAAQKGALAITAGRRYTPEEKTVILKTVQQAQAHCPERSIEAILGDLGLPAATYFRWVARAASGTLADQVVVPQRPAMPPTPVEVEAVTGYAHDHPLLGYKRLAYALMLEKKAFVRPWMVRDILAEHELLGRRQPPPEPLVRPPEANPPDQRWHTDLMVWWFADRWFWMIDVLDAYSRYLVHCQLLLTARAEDVTLAVQTALDTLPPERRRAGEPEIVHDCGSQFIGREWAALVQATEVTDVRARPHQPQSNGRDERVHRTFHEEMPLADAEGFYQAQDVIAHYRTYYNERRPHSALRYLCPREHYRGDPAAALAARADACRAAAAARQAYWEARRQP